MDSVHFDWIQPTDVFPALQSCSVASSGRITARHVAPLKDLADLLQPTEIARQNTLLAACGYDDLVVLLQEPCDREDELSHKDIMSDMSQPSTIRFLDESLQFAFCGRRNFERTVVMDVRPFRSRKIRFNEHLNERAQNDRAAYGSLEQSLALLRPKVVVVCQCDKASIEDGLPPSLSSSIDTVGNIELLTLRNGHQCIKVGSFHPMYVERTEEHPQRVMRRHLFNMALTQAANMLIGRSMTGLGILNLRSYVMHGPVLVVGETGVMLSYRHVTENDIADDALVARLRSLGLITLEPEMVRCKELLAMYQQLVENPNAGAVSARQRKIPC